MLLDSRAVDRAQRIALLHLALLLPGIHVISLCTQPFWLPPCLALLFGGEEAKLHPPNSKDYQVGSTLAEAALGLRTVGGLETVAGVLSNISERKNSVKTSGKHHFNA